MEFILTGTVYYTVGSCCDDRSLAINETFHTDDEKSAKKVARIRARAHYKENKNRTNFGMELCLKGKCRILLKFTAVDAHPPVAAVKARKAVRAHLAEKRVFN